MNIFTHYFRKAQAWLSSKRYIQNQRGQWNAGGIVGGIVLLILVLVVLRIFGLI